MLHSVLLAGLSLASQQLPLDRAPAPALVAADTPTPFGPAPALDAAMLDKTTAREDLAQVATAEQTARVSNNSVNGQSVTGNVTIDGNAFQNLQGLAVINANSGNNVAINSALNVNIQFASPQ